MEGVRANDHCLLLKVAVVARDYRALSVMRMLSDVKPGRLRIQLLAIATVRKSIACSKFAGEMDVAVYDDPMDLLAVEHLDLILEMTGDAQILVNLAKNNPPSVGVLDRQASMLIFDITGLYQQASERDFEISLASSFASALLEASPDGVMVVDRDFRIINCNESPIITGGREQAYIIGRPCFEVTHNARDVCSAHELKCPMEECSKPGGPLEPSMRPSRAARTPGSISPPLTR
jgi:PAS domain-containing protein